MEQNSKNKPTIIQRYKQLPSETRGTLKKTWVAMGIMLLIVIYTFSSDDSGTEESTSTLPDITRMDKAKGGRQSKADAEHQAALEREEAERKAGSDMLSGQGSYLPELDTKTSTESTKPDARSQAEPNLGETPETAADRGIAQQKASKQRSREQRERLERARQNEARKRDELIKRQVAMLSKLANGRNELPRPSGIKVRSEARGPDQATVSGQHEQSARYSGPGGLSLNSESSVSVNRGLLPGDILLAKLDNYVNTDSPGTYLRLTVVDGPFENAKIMAEYKPSGDVVVATTKTMSLGDYVTTLKATLVTADEKMQEGLSTETDHHTALRWSMLIFGSAAKGASESWLSGVDEVVTDSGDTVGLRERSSKDIWLGALGAAGSEVADRALSMFDTPPTIIVDPLELGVVGVMVTDRVQAKWFPPLESDMFY